MKVFLIAAFGLAASWASAIGDNKQPYSTRMIRSIIDRKQGVVSSGESTSTLESGILALSLEAWLKQYPASDDASQVADYLDQVFRAILPTFANASSSAQLPLDRLSVAQALHRLEPHLDAAESAGIETLNASLAVQRRNPSGGFWYYVYPEWSYLDGAVSFLPFMVSEPGWSAADALNQVELLREHCRDVDGGSGLLVHGYDASQTAVWANNATGGSPYVWGRSLGWYLAGLVNAWEALPPLSDGKRGVDGGDDEKAGLLLRTSIREQTATLSAALTPLADKDTGAWWQLPTFAGREGNFLESSSTALFIFSLLKGVRLGLVPVEGGRGAVAAARRAYEYTVNNFVVHSNETLGFNNTVSVCSLNSTATYEYYTSRPILPDSLIGEAAFVLASLEVERLGG